MEVLRRVWLAQYYLDEGRVRWRKAGDLPPAGRRIDSPYDPEATFGNKRSTTWTGYKVHLTETCEGGEVHLITNVETTPAVTSDVDQTAPIHTSLAAKGLLPGDHLLDAGYVDAELLVDSKAEHGVRLVGPVRPDVSWQAQTDQGFDISRFVIDWEARQVTCPEGKTSVLWQPGQDRWGNEVIHTEFARRECLACRSRPLCTRAKTEGREMTLRPRARHEALQAARRQQETAEWKAEYALRAGIEGTISEGVRGFGLRRCRYVGFAKAHLQHVITAAAMNLSRLAAWLAGVPRAKTRTSRLARGWPWRGSKAPNSPTVSNATHGPSSPPGSKSTRRPSPNCSDSGVRPARTNPGPTPAASPPPSTATPSSDSVASSRRLPTPRSRRSAKSWASPAAG